jgi:YHS domain-containing protein
MSATAISSITAATVIDPVCGMPLDRSLAIGVSIGSRTEYFCSRGCRTHYLQHPEEYERVEATWVEAIRAIFITPTFRQCELAHAG